MINTIRSLNQSSQLLYKLSVWEFHKYNHPASNSFCMLTDLQYMSKIWMSSCETSCWLMINTWMYGYARLQQVTVGEGLLNFRRATTLLLLRVSEDSHLGRKEDLIVDVLIEMLFWTTLHNIIRTDGYSIDLPQVFELSSNHSHQPQQPHNLNDNKKNKGFDDKKYSFVRVP